MRLAAAIAVVLSALHGSVDATPALEPVTAALHVHSDLSTGDSSLEGLADMADKQQLGALLVTENHLLRVEYGLPPFRALTRVAYERRSVLGEGLDRYLARVAAVRQRFPRLLIVPGVEVIPHYHWRGSPLGGGMILENLQKNLLVFGVTEPARLAGLPVVGARAGGLGLQSLLDLLPVALAVPGVWCLVVKRRRRIRIGRAFVLVRSRRWGLGLVLCAVAVVALVRGWPFTVDHHPYWSEAGVEPHQHLIDHVRRQGGVTIWSFPEARDFGERQFGPVRVTWQTAPYGDDLFRTFGYTAFGAVYEDTTRFERPGQGWDRLLVQYLAAERRDPVWAVAESGYHGPDAGKRLAGVQTVFLVRERSDAGVLDALKRGRMYARLGLPAPRLSLAEFSVHAGGRVGTMGDTIPAPPGTPIEVRIAVDATPGGEELLRVALVRNAAVVRLWQAAPPFRAVHQETAGGQPAYFRLDVGAPGNRLVGNPVFVTPR